MTTADILSNAAKAIGEVDDAFTQRVTKEHGANVAFAAKMLHFMIRGGTFVAVTAPDLTTQMVLMCQRAMVKEMQSYLKLTDIELVKKLSIEYGRVMQNQVKHINLTDDPRK